MDPYLEHTDLWPEIHHWLISALGRALAPQLRPKYRVAVEKRIYESSSEEDSLLVGIPDVTVQRQPRTSEPKQEEGALATAVSQPATIKIPMPEIVTQISSLLLICKSY